MGYVLSILMNALRTWLLTKLWDSFFTRRFNGKQFRAYWLLWTAIITVVLNVLPNDYDYSNIIRFLIEIAHEYAMNLMLYRSRWDRRLFVVITGYACFFSISVLPEKAWLLYSGMTRTEYVYNKPLYTAFIFLRGAVPCGVCYTGSAFPHTAAGKRKAARMDTGINTVPTVYIVCALPGVQRRRCRRRK